MLTSEFRPGFVSTRRARRRPEAGRTLFVVEQQDPVIALDLQDNSREFDAGVTARFSERLSG
jgi:hypothetical protein